MQKPLSVIGLSGLKKPLDCGGKYISSDLQNFLSENGVEHQMTVPHTPQQNGRAEHFNYMLLKKSEAMQQHACLLHSSGKMQLKPAFIFIIDNLYIVIIGLLLYSYRMALNLIFCILGHLVVRCMFSYPETIDQINSYQNPMICFLLAMNQEQKDITSGLEPEEWSLFPLLPHIMNLIFQIVLERNYLTNHLPIINLQKLTTKRIQIKEETMVYNLLIKLDLISLNHLNVLIHLWATKRSTQKPL